MPEFKEAITKTLKNYVSSKRKQNEEMIWFCTINNHGKYLPVMLIDFSSETYNAFFVDVAVSSSIYNQSLISGTKTFLNSLEIFPNAYLQDGESIDLQSILTVQSCSRMLFSTLNKCDVHDKSMMKYFSSCEVFKAAIKEVPKMEKAVEQNVLVCSPAGRFRNMRFDDKVFSYNFGSKLIKKIAKYTSEKRFQDMRHYIGTLFDAFKLLWDRQNTENLERNAKDFVEVGYLIKIKIILSNNKTKTNIYFS